MDFSNISNLCLGFRTVSGGASPPQECELGMFLIVCLSFCLSPRTHFFFFFFDCAIQGIVLMILHSGVTPCGFGKTYGVLGVDCLQGTCPTQCAISLVSISCDLDQ